MSDIVNDYFKRFYPPAELLADAELSFGPMYIIHRRVEGYSNIFPAMVCADGLRLSVQGHAGAYSQPRNDFEPEYLEVEIMGPKKADPLLEPYERECNSVGAEMIYPYVPVSIVAQVIAKHGGLTAMTPPEQKDD